MTTLYADPTGKMLGIHQFDYELGQPAPAGTAFTVDFDPSTNPQLQQTANFTLPSLSMPNGVLTANGQAVTINAPSADYQLFQQARQVVSALKGATYAGQTLTLAQMSQAFQAVESGSATNAQRDELAISLCRLLGLVLNRLLTNGTLP